MIARPWATEANEGEDLTGGKSSQNNISPDPKLWEVVWRAVLRQREGGGESIGRFAVQVAIS